MDWVSFVTVDIVAQFMSHLQRFRAAQRSIQATITLNNPDGVNVS